MLPRDTTPQVAISVNGGALEDDVLDLLSEATVETSLHVPDEVTLTFVDDDFGLYDRAPFKIGDVVEVALAPEGAPGRVGSAEVIDIESAPSPHGMQELRIRAEGVDRRLWSTSNATVALDQSNSDLVAAIASQLSSATGRTIRHSVDSGGATEPYVIQAATPAAFLHERAAQCGWHWWVSDDHLYFQRDYPRDLAATVSYTDDLISIRVATGVGRGTDAYTVRGWDDAAQQPVTADAAAKTTPALLGTDAAGPKRLAEQAEKMGAGTSTITRTMPASATAATDYASALAADAVADRVAAEIELLGNPAVAAGTMVELDGVGQTLSGKYLVTTARHHLDESGYRTTVFTGAARPDALARVLNAPPPQTWTPQDLTVGSVSAVETDEAPGRVKVTLPRLGDIEESNWARVVAPGAGPNRGMQFLPEIGDEVVVGFEGGDLARPLVLGGVWSDPNPPPIEPSTGVANDLVVVRGLTTRAGHRVAIHESEAEEPDRIELALADEGGTVTIGADGIEIRTTAPLAIAAKQVSFEIEEDLTVNANTVTFTATDAVTVEGATVAIDGTRSTTVGGGSVDLSASGGLTLDGGPMTSVKGQAVKLN